MKLLIDSKELKRGLGHVARAISSRGPLPILTHVYLEAREEGLMLRATDLEVGVESTVAAATQTQGAIALPFKTLAEIVAKLPAADVTIEMDDTQRVIIRCQRATFKVAAMSAAEFPTLPLVTGTAIELPRADFLQAIRQVLPCAAGEDRAVISGVFIEVADGKIQVVATDGYRLGRRAIDRPSLHPAELVIPARALGEIERHLKDLSVESITLTCGTNQLNLDLGDRRLTSRLVDGQFPPYQQIIPTAFERSAVVNREAFAAAVDRVSIMAEDREAHTIKLAFADGEMVITAGNTELGDATEALSVEYTGEPAAISFNGDFLKDAIKALDGEAVRCNFNGPLTPMILQSADDDAHLALLMPMNRV